MKMFCEQVGIAARNCMAMDHSRASIEAAETSLKSFEDKLRNAHARETSRRDNLIHAMSSISAEVEMDKLFSSVIQHARQVLEADRGTLFIVDEEKQELYSKLAEGSNEIRVPLRKGLVGYCAATGDVVNSESRPKSPSYENGSVGLI